MQEHFCYNAVSPRLAPLNNRICNQVPTGLFEIIMKNTFKLVSPLIPHMQCVLLASAAMMPYALHAAEPVPSDVPPKVNPVDEGDQAVTNLKLNKIKQTEHITQTGQQTEVKVTNSVGTYIVKPNQNVGTSLPGDASSNSNNPVQWVVKSWGGSKDTENKDEVPPTLQPNPNPPAEKNK